MLFKKNKIASGIKESSSSDNKTSSDFETLDAVKQKKKTNNLLYKLFVSQYRDGKQNIKDKYAATKTFFKKNWLGVIQWSMILLLMISFVMASCILFEPFNGVVMGTTNGYSNGDIPVDINNMYTLTLKPDGITYGLTGLGIAFTVIFIVMLILAIVWMIFKSKNKTLLCKDSKATKIISIVAYVLIILSMLALVIIAYIPPTTASITADGQAILANKAIVNSWINNHHASSTENAEVKQAILNLYDIAPQGTRPTDFASCIKWYNDYSITIWPSYDITSSYAFYVNSFNNLPSTINTVGYVIICLTCIFFISGLVVLPLTNEIIKVKEQIAAQFQIEHNIDFSELKENMNVVKRAIVGFIAKTQTSFFKKLSKFKNKDSFRKYKKEISEKGMSASQQKDSFKSDVTNNTVTYIITKEEIEKHEPNKAFLNSQGQYMYHDGNHNYFIVKNDAWAPYDIEQGVHQTQVNITSARDTDVANKQVKERKWFKNNKLFSKISEKTSKNKASIDLPDEDLNKIIGELDI